MAQIRYWLMKSEPASYSIDDLARDDRAPWDGVRNYQARNFMRDMRVGDTVLFYHSNATPPGVAGRAEVCREAYPDHTAWEAGSEHPDPRSSPEHPRWFMVDVCFVERFPRLVPLAELRADPALCDMPLLARGQRLSVMPVAPAHAKRSRSALVPVPQSNMFSANLILKVLTGMIIVPGSFLLKVLWEYSEQPGRWTITRIFLGLLILPLFCIVAPFADWWNDL